MQAVLSVNQLRQNLKTTLDDVCSHRQPLRVTRRNGEDVVVLPLSDYESLDETAYLLRSPANAKRLEAALAQKTDDSLVFDSVDDLKNALGA